MKYWMSLVALIACACTAGEPQVEVAEGSLRGATLDGVDVFLGVPYAAPPVGEKRWLPPQPVTTWQGTRVADEWSASCMQAIRGPFGPYTIEYVEQAKLPSEDCLYLNVWAPENEGEDLLPVLVWIHGGAFIGGSASVPIYDGQALAETGIVVVSINYRLGTFGFFSSPELREQHPNVAGIQGIHDMIAALEWLNENVSAFGGDPNRITIAGQSAGAAAVNILMVMDAARNLFTSAISESMPLDGMTLRTVAEGDAFAAELADKLGAMSLAELQSVAAIELLDAGTEINPMPMPPVINAQSLPASPGELAATGALAPIPVMAGVTAFESRYQGSLSDYRERYASRYGDYEDQLLSLYPAGTDEEARASADLANRDRHLMGLRNFVKMQNIADLPTWLYVWERTPPGSEAFLAHHSSEIPYVFGTLDSAPDRAWTPTDRDTSQIMSSYWSNFVKHGDPNGAGLATWPAATGKDQPVMRLGVDWLPTTEPSEDRRQFFRDFFASGGKPFLF